MVTSKTWRGSVGTFNAAQTRSRSGEKGRTRYQRTHCAKDGELDKVGHVEKMPLGKSLSQVMRWREGVTGGDGRRRVEVSRISALHATSFNRETSASGTTEGERCEWLIERTMAIASATMLNQARSEDIR